MPLSAISLRRFGRGWASLREYCQLPSGFYPAPFQIDHIIARQHGGATVSENLALACIHCNRYKGPNIAGIDRETGEMIRLFHPRRDRWNEHFAWEGPLMKALSSVGRTTIVALSINDPEMIAVRRALDQDRKRR